LLFLVLSKTLILNSYDSISLVQNPVCMAKSLGYRDIKENNNDPSRFKLKKE
jgi:hypothetical protein